MSWREYATGYWRAVTRRPSDARLALVVGLSIIVRLALLPFTAHLDLFSIYSRSAQAVYDGDWLVWGGQIPIQTLHNIWFVIVSPLLPESRHIWSDTAAVLGVGVQEREFQQFLDYEYLPRALFLLKLPYVVADLAVAFVLTRLVDPARSAMVAGVWLLNPLVIYTSVLFGRHDAIAILLVVLSALLAVRGWRYAGLALLLFAGALRFFPVLLAPLYILAFRRSRRELVILSSAGLAAWVVLDLALWTVAGSSPTLTLIDRYPHVGYLFELGMPLYEMTALGQPLEVLLFPAAYLVFVLWFSSTGRSGLAPYVAAGSVSFLLVFALTFYHPQYAIWIAPFLALAIARMPSLLPLHAIQVVLLLVHTLQWGSATTWELFLPLSQGAVDLLPDPRNVIAAQMSTVLFFSLARTMLVAISLWMAWRLLAGWVSPLSCRPRAVDRADAPASQGVR
jgi:hypothetical protein